MKNYRRLFALLMTLVMLLGMVPVASAELAGSFDTVGCNHKPGSWQWSKEPPRSCEEYARQERRCTICGQLLETQEERGAHKWTTRVLEEPTCTERGLKETICSVCGDEKNGPEPVPAKGHDWGSWYWLGSQPSCLEGGWQLRDCKRCDAQEDRWVDNGGHDWGEWKIHREPTCTEPGSRFRTCRRCGAEDWSNIAVIDHVFGAWYVAIQPQVGVAGMEQRDCTLGCGTFEQRELPPLEGSGEEPGEPVALPELTVTKTASAGSHSDPCKPGDEVTFTITVTNNTGVELRDVEITDPVKGGNEDAVVDRILSMQPGESVTASFSYTVTEEDATVGIEGFENTAYATGYTADGTQVNGTSNTIYVWCVIPHELSFSKSVVNTPANGEFFVPGETIEFAITMTNETPYPFYGITLTDPLCEDQYVYDEINDMSYLYFGELYREDNSAMGHSRSATVNVKYVVTEEDAEAGSVTNIANLWYQTWYGKEVTLSASATAKCGKASDAVILEKIDMRSPANGKYYVPGEMIKYGLTVRSTEENPLQNIIIYDPLKGGDQVVFGPADSWVLGAGFYYTVTEADAQRGYVENTGYATFTYQNTGEESMVYSNTLTLPCGFAKDAGLSGWIAFTKGAVAAPQNEMYYVPGETIPYQFALYNWSNVTLKEITFVDPLIGSGSWDQLAPGEFKFWEIDYEVTELDAMAGRVENIAYVNAFDENDNQYVEYSNPVSVLCGYPEEDDPFGVLTGLEITKEVESLPLNGSYYTEGETVAYKIIYTNIGELPLTDVMIYDAMGGMSEIATAETLTPGESRVCWLNHPVTADDVARGYINNTAVGQYDLNGYVYTVNSNTVTVDTNGKLEVWVGYPFWPGEDPDYDPGSGWFPGGDPTTEGENLPFGTIDTDALHSGDAYCVRTITGRDNASASYEVAFCPEHADTQSSALMMVQAAATPELQMQSAAYAVALWRSEVEKLYQEIYEASDPTAKMIVMTEYVRFLTDVANYESMLKVMYPDQPALVATKVASLWENKCIDLCYDAHATAAERKDSLLAVTPTTGAAAVSCTCEVTAQEAGKMASVQRYCAMHSFPFSMIDALLQGNDTAEAWTMVRQIWGVELTNAYNKIYTAMGDNKLLAMAEYNALTQWMMAREASLIALYPDNPEIVVQIMVKLIMDRVNDLCQVIK